MSNELIHELYEIAQTNGFLEEEYKLLLGAVDNTIEDIATNTQYMKTGTTPSLEYKEK